MQPIQFKPGDVVTDEELPAHDIDRLVKHGDLKPLGAYEAKIDAAAAQAQYDTLQFRRSKNLIVNPHHFEEVERRLKAANAVAKAVAG